MNLLSGLLDSVKTFQDTMMMLARVQSKTVVSFKVYDLSGILLKVFYSQEEFARFADEHRGIPVVIDVLYLEEISV